MHCAGGPAVSAADACEQEGLKLAELSADTKNKLSEIIPNLGTSTSNPIDLGFTVTTDNKIYMHSTAIVGQDENVDMLLIYNFRLDKDFAEELVKFSEEIKKPTALVANIEQIQDKEFRARFQVLEAEELTNILKKLYKAGISIHQTEQAAAKTLLSLFKYKEFLDKTEREELG